MRTMMLLALSLCCVSLLAEELPKPSGEAVVSADAKLELLFSRTANISGGLPWSPEAEARLKRVPPFVRRVVRQRVEDHVRERGRERVTPEDMQTLLRRRFGDAGPPDFGAKEFPEREGRSG